MRRIQLIFFLVLLIPIAIWACKPRYKVGNRLGSETDVTSMVVDDHCRLMDVPPYGDGVPLGLICPCNYQFTSPEIDTIWHSTVCSECNPEEIHGANVPYEEIQSKLSYRYTMFFLDDPIDVYKLIVQHNGDAVTWEIRRDRRGGLILPFRVWEKEWDDS